MALRFTTLGHAGLYVETGEVSILVDPWLIGSCYWRSWWHYPPMPELEADWLAPDYLYLSHHHFDHFHYPSLRRLSRDARCLIPRFGIDVMRKELHQLGFQSVTELRHGEVVPLRGGARLTSFQYGFDDSALVISDSDTTLVDLNDCKVRGRSLTNFRRAIGKPTFVLKSHSWAQSYPVRYTAERPEDLELLSRSSYTADFLDTMNELRPDYAVPFASMVCFLHPDARSLNEHVVTPLDVAAAFAAQPVPGTALQVMQPGDSWSRAAGFSLSDRDHYTMRSAEIDELATEVEPALKEQEEYEAQQSLTFAKFKQYFGRFVKALPPGLPLVLRRNVAFQVDGETQYWVLDFRRRRVEETVALPDDVAVVVRVAPGLLADAIDKQIVNFLHISMRIRVHLEAGGPGTDFPFWGLLTMWELGYLPLRRSWSKRMLAAAWCRKTELVDLAVANLLHRGPLAERLASTMTTTTKS